MKPIRVLVTGAGSGVGQGIMKALRIADLPVTVIAADIGPLHPGLYRGDEAAIIPRVETDGALDAIRQVIIRRAVDVVMIGSEFDLLFFARHRRDIESSTGTLVCVSPVETVEIADDKYRTTEFLRTHGLPHAPAVAPAGLAEARAAAAEFGYPAILKSRSGTSARHVHLVHNTDDVDLLFPTVPNPMIQAFAGAVGDELAHEYTCSVFTCADGRFLGPFTARRTLRGGSSWLVEVDRFRQFHELLLDIARHLPSVGSLNVQLRDGPRSPVPFEFNARFSGTTAVRAHFGFNEPAMFLRSWLLNEPCPEPAIGKGMAMRYLEEVFIDGVGAADLVEPLPRGTVRPWF